MNILVLDLYDQPRDMAQMDMYTAMKSKHRLELAYESNFTHKLITRKWDAVYLGIYHHNMQIDWDFVFNYCSRIGLRVLIDQADNEEFVSVKLPYHLIEDSILLTRYETPQLKWFAKYAMNRPLFQLNWFINAQRVIRVQEKTIPVLFLCSKTPERDRFLHRLENYTDVDFYFDIYGNEYYDTLAKARVFAIECGRNCLTQKYIEAALNECIIIGDIPKYPVNDLHVDHCSRVNELNPDYVKKNKEYVLRRFCNQSVFLAQLDKALNYECSMV